MSSNTAYRVLNSVPTKIKQQTPISQPSSKNVKKRDSIKNMIQQSEELQGDSIIKNRDFSKQKSNRNSQTQQQTSGQNNYYSGLNASNSNGAGGLLYFGGNIVGQNSSKSNKKINTTNYLNSQNSKEYGEKMTDEFSDFNLVHKKLQLNIDDITDESSSNLPKKTKQNSNLKSLPNQMVSPLQNLTPQSAIGVGSLKQVGGQKSKQGETQTQNSTQANKKGEKYISIKDTIAAYKEVESRVNLKSNEISGRPPLLISTNNQGVGSSLTPMSIASNPVQSQQQSLQSQQLQQNLQNTLKHVFSEDRLNIVGSSCQQNSQNNSEKKGIPLGINLTQRPGQIISNNNNNNNNSSCNTSSSNTQNNNKENSTTASSSSTTSGRAPTTAFNYLVNPSAALPPSKLNNINVFRIKKQQYSTRNSFTHQNQQPSSQTNIPQSSLINYQHPNSSMENQNLSVQQLFHQRISSCLQNQADEEVVQELDNFSNDRNDTSHNISSSNIQQLPSSTKQQANQKSQKPSQSPFTPIQQSKQEQLRQERNSSKNIGSGRYIQVNRQIVSAQRPPKSSNNPIPTTLSTNTNQTLSTNQLKENISTPSYHLKRNSEKYTANLLYAQQNWSPEASICQQDDVGLDQFQLSTNRSNSTQNRSNKFHNSCSVDNNKKEIKKIENVKNAALSNNCSSSLNQPLTKSNLFLKQRKQEFNPEVLRVLNTADIKPIYWKSSTIDSVANSNYERNILIIKAENLLFGGITSQVYWDKKESQGINMGGGSNMGGIINFCGNSNSYSNSNIGTPYNSNGAQGDVYGNKLNEIKRIMRTLSKHYLIFLLFNSCSKKVRDLVSYMIKTNFSFDGAYYTYSSQANCLHANKSVNLQQIIIDYKLQNLVNKVIILDAVPANFQVNTNHLQQKRNNFRTPTHSTTQKKRNLSYQPTRSKSGFIQIESDPNIIGDKNEFGIDDIGGGESQDDSYNLETTKLQKNSHYDLLTEFIPVFEDKIMEKIKVILFKQRINPNLLQANQKKVLEVALSFVDPRVNQFSNNLYFMNLDISEVTARAYQEGQLNHRKRQFLKQINKIKQSNKNQKEVIELDGDKMAETFRNRLIEYMKSTHKSIHNLYYLVGDLVVRNRNIFQKYYSDPFHCKKKNVDNLLSLDILRYKPFPQLSRQTYFRGKQAQDYANLVKQLPEKNPYDILFFPEDNNSSVTSQSKYSEKTPKSKNLKQNSSLENIVEQSLDEEKLVEQENQENSIQNLQKEEKMCYHLPFNVYLCMEV